MRRVRICIYGGTDIQEAFAGFISALAYQILDTISAVIVSGGFRHSNKNPAAISTDVAALLGARRYAVEHGTDLKACYEAWIPEPIWTAVLTSRAPRECPKRTASPCE